MSESNSDHPVTRGVKFKQVDVFTPTLYVGQFGEEGDAIAFRCNWEDAWVAAYNEDELEVDANDLSTIAREALDLKVRALVALIEMEGGVLAEAAGGVLPITFSEVDEPLELTDSDEALLDGQIMVAWAQAFVQYENGDAMSPSAADLMRLASEIDPRLPAEGEAEADLLADLLGGGLMLWPALNEWRSQLSAAQN